MPRYRAKTLCFVDGSKIRAGQEFSSDAPPNPLWEPLDKAASEAVKAAPAKVAEPPPATPKAAPIDALADKDDAWLRNYIQTKGGKMPGPNASLETLKIRVRELAGDGAD